MHEVFNRWSRTVSGWVGSQWAFIVAAAIILLWIATGPIFHYSDTWQLVINTGTTIVTFLMVFLIQNTQNRDSRAIHLKLDEIIRSIDKARNELIDLEDATDEQLDRLQLEFAEMCEHGAHGANDVLEAIEAVRKVRGQES
ncbi:MAG: low affinity iron permease family protein [Fimbriimonas sp.]